MEKKTNEKIEKKETPNEAEVKINKFFFLKC